MSHRTRTFEPDFKIYCDESCHLEHDGSNAMVFGALTCAGASVRDVDDAIKALRVKHNYVRELKWTKLSKLDLPFYDELLTLFFSTPSLRFKAVVVPDKSLLDHETFNHGSAHTFYYKIAYFALRDFIEEGKTYRLYLDYMDTLGRSKVRKLKEVLQSLSPKSIEAQTIRSHESQLIQVCDLLIGAICFSNRTDVESTSATKVELVRMIVQKAGHRLTRSTPKYAKKFNIFRIDLKGPEC